MARTPSATSEKTAKRRRVRALIKLLSLFKLAWFRVRRASS